MLTQVYIIVKYEGRKVSYYNGVSPNDAHFIDDIESAFLFVTQADANQRIKELYRILSVFTSLSIQGRMIDLPARS